MKFLSKVICAIILSVAFFACSEDSSDIKQEELNLDLSNLKLELNELDFNNSQLAFNYRDNKEASEKSEEFIKIVFAEIDEMIKSNKEITNVLFKLNFSKGKAVMKDIYVLNGKDKIVLNGSSSPKSVPNIDWESILNGASCPEGWTDNGTCSGRACIANTTAEILQDPDGGINSSGDCVEIQYNRGILSVRICSRSC